MVRHVCASNDHGICAALDCPALTGVNAPRSLAGASVAPALSALRFRRERDGLAKRAHGLARDAAGMGLASVASAARKVASEAPGASRDRFKALGARFATLRGEVVRCAEAREARAEREREREAKRQKARIAAQAALVALRVSQDATYRVWIKFARGAHALEIASEAPKGYSEARASRRVRGDAPGLRYGEAERVRDGIARKLRANGTRRRA